MATSNEMSGIPNLGGRSFISPLIVGILVGFLITTVFLTSHRSHLHVLDEEDSMDEGPENDIGFHSNDGAHAYESKSVANQMYDDVRILCWIMTQPDNHKKKARHVKRTWGSRCNKLLFMSSAEDPELESIALPVAEGRKNLWNKTKEAFKYIYKNHLDEADWFLKADDNTYVILENLRYLLYPYSPTFPIYMGCKFKFYVKQGYMSGGAGYVLSKEAVKRLVEDGLPNESKCSQKPNGYEDVEIGKCLEKLNVVAGDSRDSFGRGRFFPYMAEAHIVGDFPKKHWYWKYAFYKPDAGLDCCSDNAVSFHYVPPNQMYVLDYMIYHLRAYGMVFHSQPLPEKLYHLDGIGENV